MPTQAEQVDRNFAAFELILPQIIGEHRDEFVLMRDESIVGYFDTWAEADTAGEARFGDGIYSIQEVTDQSIHNW